MKKLNFKKNPHTIFALLFITINYLINWHVIGILVYPTFAFVFNIMALLLILVFIPKYKNKYVLPVLVSVFLNNMFIVFEFIHYLPFIHPLECWLITGLAMMFLADKSMDKTPVIKKVWFF